MRTLELAVAALNGVAILDAIFKHADIRIAFLAHAGDDEIGIGDETDTGQLVASEPELLFSFGTTSNYLFLPFGRAKTAQRELICYPFERTSRKSTRQEKLLRASPKNLTERKKAEQIACDLPGFPDLRYSIFQR